MGRRGPIPDPRSERSKTGRNSRAPRGPRSTGDAPTPPASIEHDAQALAFWDRHAPQLAAAGRLRPEQAETFAILCQLHADCVALAKQVAAEGWITATDKGQAPSPVARLLRDARRDFVALARDFGLTAAAEARLPQDPNDAGEEDDSEAALLRSLAVRRA
jgi:P27 family predicted phage terminase small subunit